MPLPYRWLTSLMTRCDGSNLLIDCGEGTQVALKEKGGVPSPLILSALLITMQIISAVFRGFFLPWETQSGQRPVTMIGPKGLERVVGALRTIAPELPFELRFIELTEQREQLQIVLTS